MLTFACDFSMNMPLVVEVRRTDERMVNLWILFIHSDSRLTFVWVKFVLCLPRYPFHSIEVIEIGASD